MLHEIIGSAKHESLVGIDENQRLEVVKITRCKMRQKDVLEIEIGLKNLALKDKPFEER